MTRKLWLDWQRGLAVLFMIEVHVLDAWLAPGAGAGGAFHALRMLGGLAAPGFLYMAGVSQALADASQARKGTPPPLRRASALRRAWWLLGVAYGFRLVEYVAGGAWGRPGGWADVLKVDILNVIAVGLALTAVLVVGRSRRLAVVVAVAAALAVVLVTPPLAELLGRRDLAASAPRLGVDRLGDAALAYLYGSWPRANFHLFNWVAFLFAGAALAPLAAGRPRPWLWMALGAGLFALGAWADRWPPFYAHQDFWRTSPSWFAERLAVCVALTGVLQLVPDAAERALRWLSLLGRQSLVAYLVSVELTYGALAAPLRGSLSFGATVLGMTAMVGVTWAISLGWERLSAWRRRRAAAQPAPSGA